MDRTQQQQLGSLTMCDLLTALSVASSVVGFVGQRQASEAKAQSTYDATVLHQKQIHE